MDDRKKGQELISVIVPVYNILDCLERCVRSICGQTYENLEILLVDDGSNDGTERLVDQLAQSDQRIRVFHKENGGSSSARNLGLDQASGEWIGFVDSDDYIAPQMYEKLLEAAKRRGVPAVQASRDEIDATGRKLPDVCQPPKEEYSCSAEAFMRELLLHRGDCSFCTKLIRRGEFINHRFPEGVLNEDFYLLVQMLPQMGSVVILPEQYYHVYYRMGSNTRKKDKNEFSRVFKDIVVNADMVEEIVREKFPALCREAVRFALFQRLDYMLHIPIGQMTGENRFYIAVKEYIRRHFKDICMNPYLSRKNKAYLLLFFLAPKTVRRVHAAKQKGFHQRKSKNDKEE